MFVTELVFPPDYPLSPPKMKFISEMFHPNGEFSFYLCTSALASLQCIKMVVCAYLFFIHLVMIPWDMKLRLSDGVLFNLLRKYFSLLSAC